jgi:hypothetical protein
VVVVDDDEVGRAVMVNTTRPARLVQLRLPEAGDRKMDDNISTGKNRNNTSVYKSLIGMIVVVDTEAKSQPSERWILSWNVKIDDATLFELHH